MRPAVQAHGAAIVGHIGAIIVGMYMRRISRILADGSPVRYLQLAHKVRDSESGIPRDQVLYHFGREDHIDRDQLKRQPPSARGNHRRGCGRSVACTHSTDRSRLANPTLLLLLGFHFMRVE